MTRISSPRPSTPHAPDPAEGARPDAAGPARPASGPTPPRSPSVGESASPPSRAASLADKFEGGARRENVETARQAAAALARELPGHGVDLDAFAARFGAPQYTRAGKGAITGMARYQFVRAALTNNPALADRAVALRLRGVPVHDRQIVEQALSRSGAAGLARYALAERTLATLQPFSQDQRADKAGGGADQAAQRERTTLADAAAQATAKQAAHAATPRVGFDVSAQTAHWNKVLDKANAAFRRLPVLSRGAEVATGVGSAIGAAESIVVGAAHSAVTLDASHVKQAAARAGNAAGYVFGDLSREIHKADSLYLQLARQHEEYTNLSRTVSSATTTHDYDAVPAAIERMRTLAREMGDTSKHFFAVAHRVDKANKEFDEATVDAAEDVLFKAGSIGLTVGLHGTAALAEGLARDEIVEHVRKEARISILKSEAFKHVNRSVASDDQDR